MYIYSNKCIYKNIYIYTYILIYLYTYIHVYIHTYIYTYIHIYIYTYIHIYIYTYNNIYMGGFWRDSAREIVQTLNPPPFPQRTSDGKGLTIVSQIRHAPSSHLQPACYTLHIAPDNPKPTPHTLQPAPYTLFILHPSPCTLHPTPYTLHPTPYTLHPATHTPQPYTLHLTLYTQHPTPHTPHQPLSFLRILEYLVIYDSGKVSFENRLLS